jgi:hypothetical protein
LAAAAIPVLAALLLPGCGCGSGTAAEALTLDSCSRLELAGGFVVTEESLCRFQFARTTVGGSAAPAEIAADSVLPFCGAGSLHFQVGDDGSGTSRLHLDGLDGLPLDRLTGLSYAARTEPGGPGRSAVALLLRVDWNGDGIADDALWFDPAWQDGLTTRVPDQGPVVPGTWQTWNVRTGGWWAEATPGFAPGAGVRSLTDYLAVHPGARIAAGADGSGGLAFVVGQAGGTWNDFAGAADCLLVQADGSTAWFDFEPAPPATTSGP